MKKQVFKATICHPDLTILGSSISTLPHQLWGKNMFFKGTNDHILQQKTTLFPAEIRGLHSTHPLFVLTSNTNNNPTVCPCSSKDQKKEYRYIKKGCRLEITARKNDRNTFLVENYRFTLPADKQIVSSLFFMGTIPNSCIKDGSSEGE